MPQARLTFYFFLALCLNAMGEGVSKCTMDEFKRIPKKTVYKRSHFAGTAPTLQSLLSQVLVKTIDANDITWQPTPDSDQRRVLNRSSKRHGCLCFEFLQFEKGKDQVLLTLNQNQKHFPVESTPVPPDHNGLPREVVESALYFAVHNDHMAIVQSTSLKSDSLEKYLIWLLDDKLSLVTKSIPFGLLDEPTPHARRAAQKRKVKKVTFGDGLSLTPSAPKSADGGVENQTLHISQTKGGMAEDVLVAVMGEEAFNNLIRAKNVVDPKNLKVKVEVSFLRNTDGNGEAILNAVAQTARHEEEANCVIELEGGTKIEGKDMKITGQVRVESKNNVPFAESMFHELSSWLMSQLKGT